MATDFHVRAYCPYDLTEFNIPVANANPEEIKKRIEGRSTVCPHGHRFHMEDAFIISVYPRPKILPIIGYPPLEQVGFLRGADVVGDKPLPSKPVFVGTPKLIRKVSDGLESFIFERELRSDVTDERFFVRMKRDVYRKFVEQARVIASKGATRFKGAPIMSADAKAAIEYLLNRESPLSVAQLSAMLEIPAQTTYSAIKQLKNEDKVVRTPKIALWGGRLYYSQNQKPRDDIIKELAAMTELEAKRKLTIDEVQKIVDTVEKHDKEISKQEIMTEWLPHVELTKQKVPLVTKPTATVPKVSQWITAKEADILTVGYYSLGRYGGRVVKFVDIPESELDKLAWTPISDLGEWKCKEARFKDMKLVRCVLETLTGIQEKLIALSPVRYGKHGENLTFSYNLRV